MISINRNQMALHAANAINAHYGRLSAAAEKLSTGLRVNSAADDAAGLAIRELMRADIAGARQGMRNAQDAVSMTQVADAALAIIDEKLIRMKELAEQAATGTYNSAQRLIIDSEFQAMGEEIDRIARATDFNGIKLLDGSLNGAHDGSGLNSKGALKIHFGNGADSAEDYYYVNIRDASVAGLFNLGGGTREVLGFNPRVENVEVPDWGDYEGQNILALPNGNMLILANVHMGKGISTPPRNIRFFEYDPDGNLLHEGIVGKRTHEAGDMQPMDARVLSNGNVVIAYTDWLYRRTMFAVYDSNWNLVSNDGFAPMLTRLGGPEDMAISVTSGSVLAGGPVEAGGYLAGNVIMSMADAACANPVAGGYVNLGPGSAATSTTLGDRHFVVKQNGSTLSGFFVDDAGVVSGEIALCEGSGAKLASFGNTAILAYSRMDAETGKVSSFGRVVNLDGSVGAEARLNETDFANANSVVDIQVMKDENGNNLDQVLVAWRNSANNGTLKAEAFTVENGELVTVGAQDIEFVRDIPGYGLGYANIAVLADGSIAANWQKNTGTYDHNAFSVFDVRWGAGGGSGSSSFSIETQQKAQEMLTRVADAITVKDEIRADLGALQNRLENTVANLSIQAENLQASESRVSDADIALEMTEFVRNQVLSQSAVAMLGQANAMPQMVLRLIG